MYYTLLNLIIFLSSLFAFQTTKENKRPAYAIAIHGGAGTISRKNLSLEKEALYRQSLHEAALLGDSLLHSGISAIEVAVAVIQLLEEDSLFNAGVGSVFTHEGTHELDASIMDGSTLKAGAVAGVKTVRNPILLARAVMDHSPYVLLTGEGAENFATEINIERVPNTFFDTHNRRQSWERGRERANAPKGTVGVVVLDIKGNLASATSTGGMTNKRWGRVGDSPIIGAGTYADNATCAVSCTGHGEYFIRKSVAYDLSARIKYSRINLIQASKALVMEDLKNFGAEGGLVALDRSGNIAMHFNSEGMYRAWKYADRPVKTAIYADEPMSAQF